jgi:hypothetical protein
LRNRTPAGVRLNRKRAPRVHRPNDAPWRYALQENLDDATHQAVVRAFLPGITSADDNAM